MEYRLWIVPTHFRLVAGCVVVVAVVIVIAIVYRRRLLAAFASLLAKTPLGVGQSLQIKHC